MNEYQFHPIIKDAMSTFWNIQNPKPVQMSVISKLLAMDCSTNLKQPILVVQPTECGKSMIPMTFGVILTKGTIIELENTITLSADQIQNIKKVNIIPGHKVSTIHLEII